MSLLGGMAYFGCNCCMANATHIVGPSSHFCCRCWVMLKAAKWYPDERWFDPAHAECVRLAHVGDFAGPLPAESVALFDAVSKAVLAVGGDGDGLVVSAEYRQLADEFEVYDARAGYWFVRSALGDAHFYNAHEGIWFAPARYDRGPGGWDIVVEVRRWWG